MSETTRATIYLDPDLHRALRLKAASTHRPISELVNALVRQSLVEDAADLAAFEDRVAEPALTYEQLLKDLKAHGKL
ncbi:MAG: CopG family transcriptional regulator [Gammaproteobacteria bacterium]